MYMQQHVLTVTLCCLCYQTLGKKARSQPLAWSGLDTTELEVGGARIGRLTADRVINVQVRV